MPNIHMTSGAGSIGLNIVDLSLEKGNKTLILDELSIRRETTLNLHIKFCKRDFRSVEVRNVFEAERLDFISRHIAKPLWMPTLSLGEGLEKTAVYFKVSEKIS